MKKDRDITLFLIFIAAIALFIASRSLFFENVPKKNSDTMKQSELLAISWMKIIQREKEQHHLLSAEARHLPSEALLGDEFSEMTTTLGSLDAKRISVNPQFAAVVVQWITELGLDSTDEVLVSSSGSFPGLAVSTLAALQTMNQRAVMVTSAGASSFGANQPAMTLIDMENLLAQKGALRYRPELITYGCENDNGEGFYEGGKEAIDFSAARNDIDLWKPQSLIEAIAKRIEIVHRHHIKLLINIGGNQAMLGNCPHAPMLPNGLHRSIQTCLHADRGAIARISELGVPIIQFLNINELGLKYGISDSFQSNENLYWTRTPNSFAVGLFFIVLFTAVVKLGKMKKNM